MHTYITLADTSALSSEQVAFLPSPRGWLFPQPSHPPFLIFLCSCLDSGATSICHTRRSYAYSLKQGQLSLPLWFKQRVSVNTLLQTALSLAVICVSRLYFPTSAVSPDLRPDLLKGRLESVNQFVPCRENKSCSLERKLGFIWTCLMRPMHAVLFCELTGWTVFTLIIRRISSPHSHLVARIGWDLEVRTLYLQLQERVLVQVPTQTVALWISAGLSLDRFQAVWALQFEILMAL